MGEAGIMVRCVSDSCRCHVAALHEEDRCCGGDVGAMWGLLRGEPCRKTPGSTGVWYLRVNLVYYLQYSKGEGNI